jgi:6-hydroxytryprostatin B O-methyltransferase
MFAAFGVFEAVPTTGDISYTDLAAKLPLTERQLRRLFRHVLTKNIFVEPRPDHVAHNSMSIAPVKNPSLVPWIGHNLSEVLRSSLCMPEAVEKWGESQNPTEVPLALAFNLEEGTSLFDWFKNDGEGEKKGWRARRFAACMAAMDGGGHDLKYVADGFDWESLGKATVVDVSGISSQCHFSNPNA